MTPSPSPFPRAFTLFELMVVIIIIGIIYGVFVQNIGVLEREKQQFKFENLKSSLLEIQDGNRVAIHCYYEDMSGCSDCRVYVDGKQTKSEIALDPELQVWEVDTDDILEKKEYGTILIDNDVRELCFEYTLYPNGSSSELIVEHNNKTYLFFPYFQETEIFDSPDEARDFLLQQRNGLKG